MLNNLKSSEDSSGALGEKLYLSFMFNPDFFFFVKGSLSGWKRMPACCCVAVSQTAAVFRQGAERSAALPAPAF